jgi:hypothetical protein
MNSSKPVEPALAAKNAAISRCNAVGTSLYSVKMHGTAVGSGDIGDQDCLK